MLYIYKKGIKGTDDVLCDHRNYVDAFKEYVQQTDNNIPLNMNKSIRRAVISTLEYENPLTNKPKILDRCIDAANLTTLNNIESTVAEEKTAYLTGNLSG